MTSHISRRNVLAAGGVLLTSGILAGCGSGSESKGPGTTGADELKRALPDYLPPTPG